MSASYDNKTSASYDNKTKEFKKVGFFMVTSQ